MRIQVRSFEAMCRLIEAGVGIGILPETAARRHKKTMKLHLADLTDAWAARERRIVVRDLDSLPGCCRALVRELLAYHPCPDPHA